MSGVAGIHHVTAIAGDIQRNLEFWTGVLGLRLVKRTVNFDDPGTYHFYFGDGSGTPGSIMTFFPWPGAHRGRQGTGQVAVTSFAVPPSALGFWIERLLRHGVAYDGPHTRGSASDAERVLSFKDPDGLLVELVAHPGADAGEGWAAPGVPPESAIRGLHAATLWVERGDDTERVLVDVLGMRLVHEAGSSRRYAAGDGGPGTLVDVRSVGGFVRGTDGVGTVHHVAFRVADESVEQQLRERALARGLHATGIVDRSYFRSVYFREPGGVLFELATDGPGFTLDEPLERLGERLALPPWLETRRGEIEAMLPEIHMADDPVASRENDGEEALEFVHHYEPPRAKEEEQLPTLLLLHGTGGNEHDLVPLGRSLHSRAGILSPRGRVLERGMPRFFRRHAEGVLDQEDLALRTEELARFVDRAAAAYGFRRDAVVAVGFSNGANIAASLLLRRPGALHAAVLLSPMVPFEPEQMPDLRGTAVFIGGGRADPMVPAEQTERLAELLGSAGAGVTMHWESGGHAIAPAEVASAARWLQSLPLPPSGNRAAHGGAAR